MSTSLNLRPGLQLRSATCDTEVIVIRAGSGEPVALTCGGAPMALDPISIQERLALVAGEAHGTVLGKRYINSTATIELLCTRAGDGSLAVAGEQLSLKATKPLPASD